MTQRDTNRLATASSDLSPKMRPAVQSRAGRRVRFSIMTLMLLTTAAAVLLSAYRSFRLPIWKERARNEFQHRLATAIAERLDRLPERLEEWEAKPIDQQETPFLPTGLAGYLVRAYVKPQTGDAVLVCLTVGPASKAIGGPQCVQKQLGVCMLPISEPAIDYYAQSEGGQAVPFHVYHALRMAGPEYFSTVFLRWSHWRNGRWQLPEYASSYPRPDDALVQLSLCYTGRTVARRDFRFEDFPPRMPADDQFIRLLMPALRKVLPGDLPGPLLAAQEDGQSTDEP